MVRTKQQRELNRMVPAGRMERTSLPSIYKSLQVGTVLKKEGCKKIVVVRNVPSLIRHQKYMIKELNGDREVRANPNDLYILGYVPKKKLIDVSRFLKKAEIELSKHCPSSGCPVSKCKILKGEDPNSEKRPPLKGRTVVGVKARCPTCKRRCKVILVAHRFVLGKHTPLHKSSKEEITRTITMKRTK